MGPRARRASTPCDALGDEAAPGELGTAASGGRMTRSPNARVWPQMQTSRDTPAGAAQPTIARSQARPRSRAAGLLSPSPCSSSPRWRSSPCSGCVVVVGIFAVYSQGLPPASELENLQFLSESIVYDRTGTVELARFGGGERRQPVTYRRDPAHPDRRHDGNRGQDVLDEHRRRHRWASCRPRSTRCAATSAAPRRSPSSSSASACSTPSWCAIPAGSGRAQDQGDHPVGPRHRRPTPARKASRRSSTAYLNQNYYGNGSYGVLAAAHGYFGVDSLDQLTLGQVALMAALPQSPSSYDLVRNAVADANGTLYVPLNAGLPIVERRNYILDLLADDPRRRVLTGEPTPPRSSTRPSRSRSSSRRRAGPCSVSGWRRISSGRCATSWPAGCAPAPKPAPRSSAAACASLSSLDWQPAADGREMGHRRRDPAPPG